MVYLVIPKLVTQPTWGGNHIAKTKKIDAKDEIIGQSYEFFSNSKLVPLTEVSKLSPKKLPYYIGTNDFKDEKLVNKIDGIIELKDLNAMKTFGKRTLPKFMVKFTQSKDNSYHVHAKWKSGKYEPKPESWYFLEEGKMTLGVRQGLDVEMYKETCAKVNKKMKEISKEIEAKKMSVEDGEKELKRFVELNNPEHYVNITKLAENAVVNNTRGGIHHSWEYDPSINPKGNIVYEVGADITDAKTVIRGYDKGKFLEDGSFRTMDVNNYFKNLTTNRVHNNTDEMIKPLIKLKDLKDWKLNKLFKNSTYQMDELIIVGKEYRVETLGFRHIFVREGEGEIITPDGKLKLEKGWSYIITPELEITNIRNTGKKDSEGERPMFKLLITYPGDQVFNAKS